MTSLLPPSEFVCPITNDIMREPVIDADGHTYEWSAILHWLQMNPRSPITRRPMSVDELKSNRALAEAIGRWQRRSDVTIPSAPPPTPYYSATPSPTYVCVNEYPYQVIVDRVPTQTQTQTATATATQTQIPAATAQGRTLRVLFALALAISLLVFLFRSL
jgi:hypothetical protein